MIKIPIIITRPSDVDSIDWPEDSRPLYYRVRWIYVDPVMFLGSRFITDATLEEISFMKLKGFTVMDASGEIVIFQDNKYIMNKTPGVLKVNCV
jgi:exosome complex RNA-binding protein Rrp42 (RNase PH superfamily)